MMNVATGVSPGKTNIRTIQSNHIFVRKKVSSYCLRLLLGWFLMQQGVTDFTCPLSLILLEHELFLTCKLFFLLKKFLLYLLTSLFINQFFSLLYLFMK